MASLATSSSLDSHTEPHHTPAAPRASAAAICRPEAMPPAASTGRLPAMSAISGVSTMVAMVPVWPPASVPWAISRSTPASSWRMACLGWPTSAATTTPAALPRATRPGGGVPSALAISEIRWLNATSSRAAAPSGLRLAAISSWPGAVRVSGTPYLASRSATKAKCSAGIWARRLAMRLSGSPAANFSGTSRSTPYGLPPVWSSIQVSCASSSPGV